jgi:transcriptional regulator with XRE-family HTH domain
MEIESGVVKKLRLEHGWSQERLAKVSGLSLRTVQRIEAGESCSVESRLSLASTFDITLSSLLNKNTIIETQNQFDPSRMMTLIAIVGVVLFLINTSGGLNIFFDFISLSMLFILSFGLTVISKSYRETVNALKLFKWLIYRPHFFIGLAPCIRTLHKMISNIYASGLFISTLSFIGMLAQSDVNFDNMNLYLSIVGLPILYSIMLSELLFRPIKHKAENLLCINNNYD